MSRKHCVVFALSAMTALLQSACQDVSTGLYEPELYSPEAETFKLDIAMLSEWEGAYAPVYKEIGFCQKPNTYFRQSTNNYTSCNSDTFTLSEDKNLLSLDIFDPQFKPEITEQGIQNIYKVTCHLVTDAIRKKYNIKDNCIHDKSDTSFGETQYYCALNLNIPNSSYIDSKWSSVFPQLFSTSVGSIQIDNVPVCTYTKTSDASEIDTQPPTLHIRSNAEVLTLQQQTLDQISKVNEDGSKIWLSLLKPIPQNENAPYYEISCTQYSDKTLCPFEGEIGYTCQSSLNGATGMQHAWHGLFEQTNVPLFIVGNGDSFGSSQPNSREFDDYPTIQLLSSLGFSADMFGNHVFDKDLRQINNMLVEANYPHVISNLSDVSQNLPNLAPYSILLVPEEGSECSESKPQACCRSSKNPDGADCLGVAVVGALDRSVMSYVQPGKFGSLQTRDYCDVLYALQSAYNANARAFFILAHVSAASDYATTKVWGDNGAKVAYTTNPPTLIDNENKRVSIFPLLQILFSLNEENTLCSENHLILPTDRLNQKRELCPAICRESETACKDICASACKDDHCDDALLQQSVTRELNREIFNSIIAVFSAAGDQHMVGFTTSEIPENTPGLVHFSMDKKSDLPAEPYFFDNASVDTKNLFNASSSEFSSLLSDNALGKLFNATPLEIKQSYFELINKRYSHPIWVIRLPEGGNTTAKLEVTLNRAATQNDRGNLAQPYVAQVNYAKLVQTYHAPEEVETPTPLSCMTNIKRVIASDDNYKGLTAENVAQKCKNIAPSNELAPACSCYNYFIDAHEYLVNETTKEAPSFDQCQKYLAERAVPNTSRSLEPSVLQNVWNCLYHSKDYAMCSAQDSNTAWTMPEDESASETGTFSEITLFNFNIIPGIENSKLIESIQNITEPILRSQTTFIGSWVTEIMLSAFNQSNESHYDALLMNAGAFNRIEDVKNTTYTKSTLRNVITYSNTFKATTLTPSAFVNYITNAISTYNEGRGQYPVFAGLMLSTINYASSSQITEVWSTHQPREFLPSACSDETCQCDADVCLERKPENYLKEPLYQLIDLAFIPEEEIDNNKPDPNADPTAPVDCAARFQELADDQTNPTDTSFYDVLKGYLSKDNNSGIYIFDPKFSWQDESRFIEYIRNSENLNNIVPSRRFCTEAYNNKLVNVYYPNLEDESGKTNTFHPMRIHISAEKFTSAGTDTPVCKCYLTAVEEDKGYTTVGPRQYAKVTEEDALRDKSLDLAVIYYIATGGDGYKLPSLVNPAYTDEKDTKIYGQASFKYLSPEAYFDNEAFMSTDSIIENYFPSPKDSESVCSGLSNNPNLYDGRSDIDFVWDNSFYRHVDTSANTDLIMNNLGSKMNVYRPDYGTAISIPTATSASQD